MQIRLCRHAGKLRWTVTNRTSAAIWTSRGVPVAEIGDGELVLHALAHPAVELAPDATNAGMVWLGQTLNVHADNLEVGRVGGSLQIRSVVLEIGWHGSRESLQVVRSPVLPWP